MPSSERLPVPLAARRVFPAGLLTGKFRTGFAVETEIARLARAVGASPDLMRTLNAAGADGEIEIKIIIQPVPGRVVHERRERAKKIHKEDVVQEQRFSV